MENPPSSTTSRPAPMPAGYDLERVLSDRPEGRVLLARRGTERVVLRVSPAGDEAAGSEVLSELAVLAAVDHGGIARALDCGALPGGAVFSARAWVEGEELGRWARDRDPREVGAAVARLTPALAHLHAAGFVHGDLKPANVIVREDGGPILCDFGLARRVAGAAATGGTLFALAPEVLGGAPPAPEADLFALGVLLHQLLIGERASARDFYARFPVEPFLAAAGTPVELLPEWARDLVEALVATDPAERPGSAAEVGAALAARLGIELPALEPPLSVPVALGRRAHLEELVRAVGAGELVWCEVEGCEAPEELEALLTELLRTAALGAAPCRSVDPAAASVLRANAAELDRWARGAWRDETGLLLRAAEREPWCARAISALARSRPAAEVEAGLPGLCVLAAGPPAEDGIAWRRVRLEPLHEDELRPHLEACIEPDGGARSAELAERVSDLAAGSATRATRILERLVHAGVLLHGNGRLRHGRAWPADLALAHEIRDLPEPPPEARELLAALAVAAEGTVWELASAAELSPAGAGALLVTAVQTGHARRAGGGRFAAAPGLVRALESGITAKTWRVLHARRARELHATDPATAAVHAACAGEPGAREGLRAELARLRERGESERALGLLDRLDAWDPLLVSPSPAERAAERALAWCGAGSLEQAEAVLDRAPAVPGDGERAALERARGRLAFLRRQPDEALAHLARAAELDAELLPEATVSRLHLLLESGRFDDVVEQFEEVEGQGALTHWPRVEQTNARSLAALARFRRGELERARRELTELLEAGMQSPRVEAAVRMNLATVERRAGAPERAARELERAVELFDSDSHLEGAAQARTALGGALRECEELVAAEEPLRTALGVRERLGDVEGAAVTRGTLGLLLAERGHARPALEELEAAARALHGARARRFTPLLEARAVELRARIGTCGPDAELVAPIEAIEPRAFTGWARALLLTGRDSAAAECIERAAQLGESLGLAPVAAEAQLLRTVLEGRPLPATESGGQLDSDLAVLHELAAPGSGERGLALARSLASRGRDDRAARMALAVAARATSEEARAAAVELARQSLGRCTRGLAPSEALVFRSGLLGIPDPHPQDLEISLDADPTSEEFEMEVLSLLDINHRLVEQQDLPSLLGAIVDSALEVTGAERGFLVMERDGELVFDTAHHAGRGVLAEPETEVSHSIVRRALGDMRSQRLSNAADDPLLMHAPSVSELELRSVLCAPFRVASDLRGAIYVDHRVHAAAFDGRAQKLLELLADQAALAIRQVKRFEEIRDLNAQLGERVVRQEVDLRTARRSLAEAGMPVPAGGLVGSSSAMTRVRSLIERAAPTHLPVLVRGPSGTGKELAARALHELSHRASGPFVTENFAALPESLIESELFGYARGAFTGADKPRAGLFERAAGGTIFLDEIGDMPLGLQAKLLRVLEACEVRRLGESEARAVDFRLVAATNRNLEEMVADGSFREDLFYRLAGLVVDLPSLAKRAEDVPELVEHFLRLLELLDGRERNVAPAVMRKLARRPWPGNVRELRNEVERLGVLCGDALDDPELVSTPGPAHASVPERGVLSMAELERRAIQTAIEHFGGDKRSAAGALGISLAKLYQRLKQYRDEGDAAEA